MPWLFGRRLDLVVFLGSFLLSMALLGLGALTGDLHAETPPWAWLGAVVLVDVAHVWSTIFVTYASPLALRARPRLLLAAPLVAFTFGVGLFALGRDTFWRALAYLAIFHFVRQQYGWVRLYRARAHETGRLDAVIDAAAIYAATLYPLAYWHTHLPRRFSWFVDGDIVSLPPSVLPFVAAFWATALAAYAVRAATRYAARRPNPGKDIVVLTTAIAWYVGIVTFDSDYAFTVTNVFMHGIPYVALVLSRAPRPEPPPAAAREPSAGRGAFAVRAIAVVWCIALFEELLWDRAVWHERGAWFGEPWSLEGAHAWLVPLLALPQATHYVLDGFLWRRRGNPHLAPPR